MQLGPLLTPGVFFPIKHLVSASDFLLKLTSAVIIHFH